MGRWTVLEPVVIRPLFGRVVAVVMVVAVTVGVVTLGVSRPEQFLTVAWIPLLGAALAWVTLWLPSVHIDEHAVTVRNVFTTTEVPWSAIQRVDTKWALTLDTAEGQVVAWAAPAPGRHTTARIHSDDAANLPESAYSGGTVRPGDVPRSDSGDAATIIRFHLESLRDGPATQAAPDAAIRRTLHVITIAMLAVLAVATVIALIV